MMYTTSLDWREWNTTKRAPWRTSLFKNVENGVYLGAGDFDRNAWAVQAFFQYFLDSMG
jgi:hypothetical protein